MWPALAAALTFVAWQPFVRPDFDVWQADDGEYHLLRVYVFGAAMSPTGPSPDAILRRRKSVLDNLHAEIGELNQIVGNAERARLQLHLDSIRQIETRLAQPAMTGGGGACMKPVMLGADPANDLQANLAHLDIIVGAFACDITRVAGPWINGSGWGKNASP